MSDYFGDYKNFKILSVGELKEKIQSTLRNNKTYEPVIVKSSSWGQICKSWWGEAWCDNLERYADFHNRIGRGKNYVRNGAVTDLKINGNEILARVQGSSAKPYRVTIKIDSLSEENQIKIANQATGKIQDLESLISGNFPEELKELFFQKNGLFPSASEIHFSCNCPDWANMCKHVAAALYGVAVRLDENPLYFFKMRGIDISKFADKVIKNKVQNMIEHANVKSPRIIENADISMMFGVTE